MCVLFMHTKRGGGGWMGMNEYFHYVYIGMDLAIAMVKIGVGTTPLAVCVVALSSLSTQPSMATYSSCNARKASMPEWSLVKECVT